MQKFAFTMQLKLGNEKEYQRRHDEIWPELVELLKQVGISEYSIHLDTQTGVLFAVLDRRENHGMDELPKHPIMQRWWAEMADLMVTNEDNSPVIKELTPLFYMP